MGSNCEAPLAQDICTDGEEEEERKTGKDGTILEGAEARINSQRLPPAAVAGLLLRA